MTVAAGASTRCEQWAVLSTSGSASGRVEVCSAFLRDVPRLQAEVALLNQRAATDADSRRDLERFAITLNQMAKQLKAQDARAMVESVVARLEQQRRSGDAEVMDELARLRLGMGDMARALQRLSANEGSRRELDAAMAQGVGASIAQLDFDSAKKMLSELGEIKQTLIDMKEPAEARVLLASERRRALQQMDSFLQAGAERDCPVVYQELLPVLEAADKAEQQGRFQAARQLLMTVWSRAAQAAAELQSVARIRAGLANQRVNEENDFAYRLAETERRLEQLARQLASETTSAAQAQAQTRESIANQQQVHRNNAASSQAWIDEAQGDLAAASARLRAAQALPDKTESERAQREREIGWAREKIDNAQRNLAQRQNDAARSRADAQAWEAEQWAYLQQRIARDQAALKLLQAAHDHLAAAIAKARVDGKKNPADAADDLRLADTEASAISSGEKPMPRPRRVKPAPWVMPHQMCS